MRVAFIVERHNYYRLFGPVIDRALARGWAVECWHASDEALKGASARERRDRGPTFRHGRPQLREYGDSADLRRQLAHVGPDVLVALRRPPGLTPDGHTRWLGLQYTLDLGDLVDARGGTPFDAIGVHTAHWRARAADSVRILEFNRARAVGRTPAIVDDGAVNATMRQRSVVVGFPEMDQFHTIDPVSVRRSLGLDSSRPVVVFCPFAFRSNPRTFWVKHIYGGSRIRQQAAVRFLGGRRYRRNVENGYDDRGVARAVRAFCDANGATLIVKARAKDPVPRYLRAVADHVLYDRADYPATILQVMSIASLCLHFFSTVAYEAAYASVPSICVTADGDDLGFPPIWREWFFSTLAGSSFNFPGVIYPRTVGEIVADLPGRRLADFPLGLSARSQYLERFVGADDGQASERLLDAALTLTQKGTSMTNGDQVDNRPIGGTSVHRNGSRTRQDITAALTTYYTRYYRDTLGIPGWRELVAVRLDDNAYERDRLRSLVDAVGSIGDARMLNVGCGTGGFNVVAEELHAEVWGVDESTDAVAIARARMRHGSRALAAMAEALPFPDGSFDLVYCYSTIEHVYDARQSLREIVRVMRPDGRLYMHTNDRWSCWEGHYKVFWIPWLPRPLARAYLAARRRPTAYLPTLRPLSRRRLVRLLDEAGGDVVRFFDADYGRRVGGPLWPLVRLYYRVFGITPYITFVAGRRA